MQPSTGRPWELIFLGTAAAEGYPAPFCSCAHCTTARLNGGRDLRRRSALLVNADLLIDFGPDVFCAFQQLGLTATHLRLLLITHAHADHLAPENLEYRRHPFRGETPLPPLTICGPQDALDLIIPVMGRHMEDARLRLLPLRAGETIEDGRYTVYALPAAHGEEGMECLLYLIEGEGRRFLYATDTGPFPEGAWACLRERPPQLAILDATMGTLRGEHHMGIEQVKALASQLRGLSASIACVAHHFSHNANPSYEELIRIYGQDGIRVAYDGLRLYL